MSKHTKEPWSVHHYRKDDKVQAVGGITDRGFLSCSRTIGAGDIMVAECHMRDMCGEDGGWPFPHTMEEMDANVQRIIACVNACEGMEDPIEEIRKLRKDGE